MIEVWGKSFGTPYSTLHVKKDPMWNSDQLPEPCRPILPELAPNYIAEDNQLGACRRFQIHRPEAKNSMDINLAHNLRILFQQYDLNDSLTSFMCHTSSHGKWFCSGHDMRELYKRGKGSDYARDYFRELYQLASVVDTIKRPGMVMLDGTLYGGPGAVLGLPGQFRYTTDFTVFSMPDCQVGFFADGGAMHYLSKLPHSIGTYLVLTGRRINAADLHFLGLADYHAPGLAWIEQFQQHMNKLWYEYDDNRFMHMFSQQLYAIPKNESLTKVIPAITRCFSKPTVPEIMEALEAENSAWGTRTLAKLQTACPLSLCVTLEYIQRAAKEQLSLYDTLKMDYRIAQKFLSHDDFFEGVHKRIMQPGV